ncbi:Ig-like domain-containing protein, partial [Niastella vici]|uniref:Ig-like domain-containing protein n=1 Tax=Niastella vici TaxID=1703345 RepID=UPI00117F5C00
VPAGLATTTYYKRIVTSTLNGTCTATSNCVTVTINNVTAGVIAASQTICSGGDPAAFTVTTAATGSGPLTYQWQSSTTDCTNGFTDISGATSATYDAPTGFSVTTYYRRVATSTLSGVPCSATSNCLTVTVNNVTAGTIGTDQTICSGGDPAAFTVTTAATGAGTLSYQWQSSTTSCAAGFSNISGATSATYDVPAGLATTTYYKRIVTSTLSGTCTATSNCVTVTINTLTAGTIGSDQTICSGGDPAAFNVTTAATGAGTLTYQWQSSTTSCAAGFADISGATGATYDAPTGLAATTYYRRIVTSTFNGVPCTAISNCATVTINTVTAGSISADQTICSGGDPNAFTSVAATGAGSISYQWQSSTTDCTSGFTNISGATSATYNVAAGLAVTTYYRRIATSTLSGVLCTATSNCVTVTVNNVTAGTVGSDQTICSGGDPAAFTETTPATGGGTLSYQWQSSTTSCAAGFSNISGATSATYDVPGGLATTTYYKRIVTSTLNGTCTATSNCVTVTVNPLPAAPTSPVSASRCGTGTVNLSASTAAGTTLDWYDAASGGNLVGTGTTFTTPSISATTTYYAQARNTSTGCVSATRTAATATINALPTVTVSPASAAFCSGNSVTLTASGANTYTWSPATDLSITTGSIVIAYPSVTTTYTVTGTGANGCTGTATVPITVTQSPSGDVSSSPGVCPGANSGTLTLSNYTGNILRWESSTDGGANWTNISNTTTSQSYLNLTTTTIYRVYMERNGCYAYSSIGIVPVNPPFTPTATATPTIFCLGQSATLKASDYGPPPFPVEDFQNANPAGWSGNDANSNNKDDNSEWGETNNGKIYNGVLYNSNALPTSTKFMIVNGDGGGSIASLITPPFSLVGVINPTFNYYTALNFNVGTTGWVEISTDGGLTYTTLKTYTGPTNVGNPNNGFIQESINLSAYIGQSNVRVRFRYSGTTGSNWAIDNVGLAGTYQPVTYQWSPTTYLTPATGVGQTVTTTPTVAGTFTYCVVATTAAGCASSPVCVDVTAKPIPTCSITGNNTVCPGSTNVYSAPAVAGYTYNWTISGGATISGSATGQTVTVVANNTCGTYTLTLKTTLNGCSSAPCTQVVNVVDNTAPLATAPATQSFQCLADVPAPGTLTATDNCSGNITKTGVDVRVANGCGYTITRTWTFTDACNNTSSVSQIINVLDNTAPVAPAAPASQSFQCLALVPAPGTLTATDNCSGNITATGVDVQVANGCGFTITRTWTFTDACNNTSSVSQIINVQDNIPPVITCPPAQTFCEVNSNTYTIPPATASDNCSGTLNITYQITGATTRNGTGTNASGVFNVGVSTITWTVTDACGNTATCTTTVTINPKPAPIIYHN